MKSFVQFKTALSSRRLKDIEERKYLRITFSDRIT